jgi:hypothetical protein
LIVEDERITAEDLVEVLKDLGYQISAVVLWEAQPAYRRHNSQK